MKKIFTYLIAVVMLSFLAEGLQAQPIGNYIFGPIVNGTFTPLVGSTVFTANGGAGTLDDGYSLPISLPFTFNFGGTGFTSIVVNTNGWLEFGTTMGTTTNYLAISGTDNNVVAFISKDLNNVGATYSYLTTGVAPNRIFKLEALNFYRYSVTTELGNAQVWLYETSGVIEFHYGAFAVWSTGYVAQVGLRGTSTLAAQVKCLNGVSPTTWTAPVVGNNSASTMDLNALPASGLIYSFSPPPPCVVPSAQPTALVLTPFATSINGSFTAAPATDDYLVVRSLSSTLSATPVNGTTYVPGAAFGGGFIVSYGPTNTFVASGLALGTQYYFFVFSANDATCSGGPLYRTASPLTGNTTTLPGISGIKTIPGDYPSIAAAIAAINANGVGNGGVTFNVAPGYTETFLTPTAGLVTTTTPTVANQCIFKKNGVGVNPKVTAPVGVGSYDYIIAFAGTDYITFDGIDVQESAANVNTTTQMEWGYAILKASATDGSQNVTIKNCTITLNNTNLSTWGIYSNDVTPAAPSVLLTVTATTGNNSFNKFYGNTVNNSYGGIYLNGYSDANFPYLFYDQNNDIGSVTGNTFTNIGGGLNTIYGMYLYYQNGLKVANSVFSGTLTSGVGVTVYVIYAGGGTNANLDIYSNNLTFTYTGTTSTLYGIYNGIGSSGVNNTVNIYNNTVTINYSTATSGSQYSVYQSSSTYNFNCYGNNIINNVIGSATTLGTGTWAGLYTFGGNANGGSFWNIYNNTVSGNSRVQSAFSTGTSYGIYNSSSGLALTVYNNTVTNNSWPSSSTCYCMDLVPTNPITYIVRKNTVSGNSKPNAVINVLPRSGAFYGILVTNSQLYNTTTIDSNNVFNLTNTWGGQLLGLRGDFGTTGTGIIANNTINNLTANDQAIFCIYNASGLSNSIFKNNIYNISATIGDSASFYGICTGSATAYSFTNVYNNFMSDMKAPQAVNYLSAGLYAFTGIATGTMRFYYNTVYLNQTPTLGSPATSCVYASTIPIIDLRNNILYNNSGILPGGVTIAYWRSGVSPATYSNLSNNNCLYAGTPSATNFIYFDFTNADQTLAAYQTRYPQEAASFTEVPPFVNVAATPYNLHLQTTIATGCESGGQPIASPPITTDYDGQVRSATTPDVGADEFAGIPLDNAPPTIAFAPLANGPVAVTRSFSNVAITDQSGVNTVSGTRPRCYYKKSTNANTFNDNTSLTDGWKWVEATGTTSPFTFTINYALLQGGTVTGGDIIQYFVDAQDLAGTVHVGMRLGSFTLQPASVNLASTNFPILGTILQYSIIPSSISGTVTVGTAGTYLNLTGATGLFAAINAGLVTGNITANIISDLTEDGSNALNQWIEDPPNSNYTLTIQPSAATLRTISGNYAGGLIRLNGADRVTFNGNFSAAGNWLTFINTAASGTVAVFDIMSLGTTLGAVSNTIKNCNISSGFNTGTSYGIFAGGTSLGVTGDDNENLTITGNVITKVYYGIYCYANSTGFNDNLVITNNTIGTAVATDYIGYYGMYIYGANAPLISGNEIFNLITTVSTASIGMEIASYVINATITLNKIHDIQNNNSGGWGAYGIDFSSTTFNIGNKVFNNLIYNITTINYSGGTTYSPFGIRLVGGNGTKIYDNTVRMTGTQNATGASASLSAALVITSTSVAAMDVRDNIFTNNVIGLAGTKSYAIYMPLGTPYATLNYNDYYASGAYGVLGYLNADIATVPAWQALTGQDLNSVTYDPVYVSATDQHPTAPGVNNAGVAIAGITTDYAGVTRGNPPDLGAYEFTLVPVIVTTAATGITGIAATLNGSASPMNEGVFTTSFDYGPTIAYGNNIAATPVSIGGPTTTPMSAAASGLTPNTLYHFRAKGILNATNYFGVDLTFNTLTIPPTVVTTAAAPVAGTTATLNGTVNANNATTTVSFDYGLTAAYGTNVPGVPVTVNGTTVTAVLANLTGLLPCTLYHYRVNGVNAGGTANGNDLTFTTTNFTPFATTLPATGVGNTNATLNGNVTANCLSTTVVFNYGLTVAYGSSVPGVPSPLNGNTATAVSASLVGLTTGVTYHYQVCATNGNGTTCGTDQTFTTACPVAGPAGPITGSPTACQGQCGYTYSVAPIANATGYSWTLPTGGTITAGANTNSITVCYSPTAASGTVVVFGTAACGAGADSQFPVTINPPASPTIAGPASVCINSTGNVYTTQTGMTNYQWTVTGGTITGGGGTTNNTVTVTWTSSGAKTVCVNYTSLLGCPAIAPVCYTVTVNPLPSPIITGSGVACTNPGYTYSCQAGMTSYVWTITAGGIITGGNNTNTITVTWNTAGAQSVSANFTNTNGCTAASPTVFPVTVSSTTIPVITGVNSLCVNSGYYFYSTQAGMSSYIWNISAGGVLIAGQNTNTIQVQWPQTGAQWVSADFTNAAGCYAPTPTVFNVTVNPAPDPAGGISGTLTVCAGANGVAYSCLPVPNALTYVWILPAGATIASGFGTNSITVNFAANASSGNITVYGNNLCGDGPGSPPFPVTVNALPGNAGNVTGPATVCIGSTGVVYSVLPIANATAYVWTVPAGATINGPSNTSSITVDFGPAAVSGNITVLGTNTCGNGTPSPNFAVTVNPIPQAPIIHPDAVMAGDTLFSSVLTGNQWYFNGNLIPGATGNYYVTDNIGTYTDVVISGGCSSPPSNSVFAHGVGISEKDAASVNIFPVPNDGVFKLTINCPSKQTFTLHVYNSLGVVIFEQKDIEVRGLTERMVDLRPAPNGVYSVVLSNSDQQIVKKIVINK